MRRPKAIASALRHSPFRSLRPCPCRFDYLPVLARAAFLHDIGKMAIPDSILRKPGPLDNDEKTIMRTHCDIGYQMLTTHSFPAGCRGNRAGAPGILRWHRLSAGLAWRADPPWRTHLLHRRCAGRHDQRPALSQSSADVSRARRKSSGAPARSSTRRSSKCLCPSPSNTGWNCARTWARRFGWHI